MNEPTSYASNMYSGALKSESSHSFSQFWLLFYLHLFNILPIVHVEKCSMHFIISQCFVCPRIFFFLLCFSSARLFKFSDHLSFYIFPEIINYISQVIQTCRIMLYFLLLQTLDGIYIRRLTKETLLENFLFVLSFLNSFLHR